MNTNNYIKIQIFELSYKSCEPSNGMSSACDVCGSRVDGVDGSLLYYTLKT